ncbi:MAG: hypothetical protein HYU66_25335 [Armatimonadetes bacterium]|nr:hypothetical protein [Armatimonadota bacterium]
MVPLLLLVTALGAGRLPDGVLLFWNADNDDHNGWRDNHWTTGGSPLAVYDAAEKREGRAALRLTGEPEHELWLNNLTCPAEVAETGSYVLRFFARTAGVKGTASVKALAHHAEGDRSQPLGWAGLAADRAELLLPADSDWTRYEVPIRRLPGTTNRLYLYLCILGPGTVWYDDVSIAAAGVEVPVGGFQTLRDEDYAGIRFDDANLPAELLTNGGLEENLNGWGVQRHGADIAWSADPTGRSKGCAKLTGVEFHGAYLHQQVPIDPRRRYRLTARVKADGLVGYVFARVLRFNQHGQPFGWAGADHASDLCAVSGRTDGWVAVRQEFEVSPDTASVVVFWNLQDTIGTAWVDDVSLAPLALGKG